MRIFIALPLSTVLKETIERWLEPWQKKIPARWLLLKNLHLTIIPPWAEENVAAVEKTLRAARNLGPPFRVHFNTVRYGPDPHSPRLIWAEGEAPAELSALKNEIEKRLHRAPEKRPLLLHLTLARFRPDQFSSFPVQELNIAIDWRETITSLAIMESQLSPHGADYRVISKINL